MPLPWSSIHLQARAGPVCYIVESFWSFQPLDTPRMKKFTTQSKSGKVDSFFWAAVLVIGAVHAFLSRYAMNADGVSYIDIGESYFRLPPVQAVSGYFSPLYSWIIGSFLVAFQPGAKWEAPLTHLVNYILFLFALWSFTQFVKQLLRLKQQQTAPQDAQSGNEKSWAMVFYALFVWAALRMITLATVAPDMLYTAIIFLLFAQLINIRLDEGNGWLPAAGLGFTLGAAFLTRAAVLPVAAMVLAAFLFLRDLRRSLPRLFAVLIPFVLVAAPYVALLSSARGRLTLAEAGTMNYAWLVNGKPFQNWQGPGAIHPTRISETHPPIYEFATPLPGTYPPWYDPAYWNAGMLPEYHIGAQVVNFIRNSKHLLDSFFDLGGIFVGLISLHLAVGTRIRTFVKGLQPVWFLILPSAAALAMYACLHVEPRYIVPFWLTLWIALFFALPLSFGDPPLLFSSAALAAMLAFLSAGILYSTFVLSRELSYLTSHQPIAAGLMQMGVFPGERIATVGVGNNIYWARLAHARIVAEITPEDAADFWAAPENAKSDIYRRLSQISADVIVARGIPTRYARKPWRPISDGFYACRLSQLWGGVDSKIVQ
jgi:hypothetical protein